MIYRFAHCHGLNFSNSVVTLKMHSKSYATNITPLCYIVSRFLHFGFLTTMLTHKFSKLNAI